MGGSRNRGHCTQRANLGFGAATSRNFGQKCDQHERRKPQRLPPVGTPPERERETMAQLRARLRREARRAERRRVLSRGAILEHARKLSLVDVQWLRGELAGVAVGKVRER